MQAQPPARTVLRGGQQPLAPGSGGGRGPAAAQAAAVPPRPTAQRVPSAAGPSGPQEPGAEATTAQARERRVRCRLPPLAAAPGRGLLPAEAEPSRPPLPGSRRSSMSDPRAASAGDPSCSGTWLNSAAFPGRPGEQQRPADGTTGQGTAPRPLVARAGGGCSPRGARAGGGRGP